MTPAEVIAREPSEYQGELLCARCGKGEESGNYYKVCTDGVPHEKSCAIYNHGDIHVCERCDEEWTQ